MTSDSEGGDNNLINQIDSLYIYIDNNYNYSDVKLGSMGKVETIQGQKGEWQKGGMAERKSSFRER
jgi:hypothetical protein